MGMYLLCDLGNPKLTQTGTCSASLSLNHHRCLVRSFLSLLLKKRVFNALSPGEILPRMPLPTHADPTLPSFATCGLPPFNSVNSIITQIPLESPPHPDHDPVAVARLWTVEKQQTPYDGNFINPRTITTHGAGWHPNGERNFTRKEYAALQGFPPNHVFKSTNQSKQVGNAVPPCVAKVLFESIKEELEKADGVVGQTTIVLDD
jgi:DNA (cytosine-5)-methyltransferase 1